MCTMFYALCQEKTDKGHNCDYSLFTVHEVVLLPVLFFCNTHSR